jgi:hypothetical protein
MGLWDQCYDFLNIRAEKCGVFCSKYCWGNVVIIIFCDFGQFSAKEIGVFLKIHCYDPIFAQTSQNFSQNFFDK